ncbi:MAG TPA: phosphatase PAP2 family protein, partial [Micromonosporaceae bacterium]
VVVLLVLYNVSRGVADKGIAPHVTEMIHADEKMFGWLTGGVVPTVYLQQHLYHMHVQWYDVLVSFVYFSHFVTALVVAVVLWLRNRDRWSSFIRRFITLNVLGLATYFLYPAAPPWWASDRGFIQPTYVGLATRGWSAIGLHGAGNLLNAAKIDAANPVAAMPSLHSAYALLVVAFFMPTIRKRWWPLLLAYPLAMTFTLVYSGEHYMTDVLVGWFYVLITMVGVSYAEKRWAAWRQRRVAATGSVPTSPAPVPALAAGVGTAPALTAATATTAATPATLAPAAVPVRPNAPPAAVPASAGAQAAVAGQPAPALDGAQPASPNGGSAPEAWSDADDAAAEIAASVVSPMRANGLTE